MLENNSWSCQTGCSPSVLRCVWFFGAFSQQQCQQADSTLWGEEIGRKETFCLKASGRLTTTGKVLGGDVKYLTQILPQISFIFSVTSVFDASYQYALIYSLYTTPYPVLSPASGSYAALGLSDVSRTGCSCDMHGSAVSWCSCLPIIWLRIPHRGHS